MSKFSKYLILLFTTLVFLAGLKADFVKETSHPFPQEVAGEASQSYISDSWLNKVYCLQPSVTNVVHSVNTLPAPEIKNFSSGFLHGTFPVELRVQSIASQYLLHSKEIVPALSVRDIIFPFHYFL